VGKGFQQSSVHFIGREPVDSFTCLLYASAADKNIWLLGGASIANEFLKNDLIDEFIITIIPILLGDGISLFKGGLLEKKLKLVKVKDFNMGVTQLHYSIK